MLAIPTNDSRKDAWKILSLLTSSHNVKRLLCGDVYSGRVRWPRTTAGIGISSTQIAACIRNAREYFIPSNLVTLNISPLLIYYGALSLAKAMILSSRKQASLDSFRHHGLSMVSKKLDDQSSRKSLKRIDERKAIVKKGVFHQLCDCIQTPCKLKTEYSLREVLRVTPDISDIYIRYYNEYSHVVPVSYLCYKPDFDDFGLSILGLTEHFEAVFPEIVKCTKRIGFDTNSYYHADELSESLDCFLKFIRSSYGCYSEMIRPLKNGIYMPFATMQIGLYILSSLVRYEPDIWIEEVVNDRSGLRPVIEAYCYTCSTWLPIEALRSIHCIEYVFHSPGVKVFEDPLSIMNEISY